MALDLDLLMSDLKEIKDSEKKSEQSKYIWKPTEGLQVVRLVPYKHNPKTPFIKLKFYYKLAGRNYLAPCTFGKPDPILEFVEKLRASGIAAQRELANRLEPKQRTYAPIIVRGKEEEGVKFWGFGVLVYKALLTVMTDQENWGDITSFTEGNDIKVEFVKESKKKGKDGKAFPDTTINILPKKTPVVDLQRDDLVQKIKDQPDILSIWPLPTYEDLKLALDKFVNPEKYAQAGSSSTDDSGTDDTEPQPESITKVDTSATATPVATTAGKASSSEEWADFFNKK